MAASTAPLIFQHCPLLDSKTHIRLLKLLSVVKARSIPVHCELTTFSIAEAPPYRAISYTWGDEAPLASILVNGQQMEVRMNCEYALRQTSQQAGGGAGDLWIWIDSICINQLDNDEKGAQVAMMGRIFKTATQVLACVGAHGEDSEFLYKFLLGEEAMLESILLSDAAKSWETSLYQRVELSRKQLAAWRWKYSRSTLVRLCKALSTFLERPYFHRVWVYQELFLGRDIRVYCGDETLPISWIWMTSSIVTSWLLATTNYLLFFDPFFFTGVWHTLRSSLEEASPLLLAGAKEQPLLRLSRTTTAVATLSCQDPRDNIYGILSIIIPIESQHFQPDYTRDRWDLAVEVLQKTRPETFGVYIPDFETHLASYARRIGLNLNLKDEPSQNLVAAVELRRSPINLHETVPDVLRWKDELNRKHFWPFLGFRIIFRHGKWGFEHEDKLFLKHGPTFIPPRLKGRPQGDETPSASVGINLPPEAQDGDWLLMPSSHYWMGQHNYPGGRIAFLARHCDSEGFEIVGKVLISFKRKVSKWDGTFRQGASIFKVYCDPEDLLVLFELCKWDNLWAAHKFGDPELCDAYFQTRFCGQRFSSYAIRMNT